MLSCLLPANANAQNDDQAAVRRAVEELIAACQRKDLSQVMSHWSEKAPDLIAARQMMWQTFSTYRTIEVKSLNINKITVEGDKATVQFVLELNVVRMPSGATAKLWISTRTLQLIRESGTWKVWKHITAEDELAAAMSGTKTAEEAMALLAVARPELLNFDLFLALVKQIKDLTNQRKSVEAMSICELALKLAQRLSDNGGISVVLRLKGDLTRARADAKQYYDESLKLAEEFGDQALVGEVSSSLGIFYSMQTNYPQALTFFQRDLHIREELGDKLNIARELSNIGNIYVLLGDNVRALDSFQRSLILATEVDNKAGSSAALINMGNVYYSQGNYPQALEYYQQSLKIKREIGDKAGEGRALNNSGSIYALQRDYAQALDTFRQNLKIKEESGDKEGILEVLHNIGVTYFLLGEYTKGLEYDRKVLKLAEELGHTRLLIEIWQNMADCHLGLGQYTDALEQANQAAQLANESGSLQGLWNARTVAGRAQLALYQTEAARKNFLEAIGAIEKLRSQVAGGEQQQQLFFENKLAPYQGMIDLSLAQKNQAEALSYAERAKGRVLLDVLSSGREKVTKAMTPDELSRDQTLVAQITSLNTQLGRLKTQPKPNESQVADLTTQLDKARLEYEAFQVGLYAAHPELKIKRGETPLLKLDEVAELLPNRQTAILEYVVTEDKTYLFVLRKSLRNGAPVDLTVHMLNIKSEELADVAESFRQAVAERNLTIKTPARKLYDLLVKPAEAELHDVRRLCIVPDGSLWNLPFQALQGDKGYLLEQFAVYYAPSLSVLREMGRRATALTASHHRRAQGKRMTAQHSSNVKNAQTELLALGNPTLNGDTIAKARLTRRDEPLGPLPDAEKEVNFLGRLYGRLNSRVLIGAEAQEATVKAEAGNYEVLHFATHAVLDDRNPLYSRIILSRVDGEQREDGLLEAWEIMKLDLNAELAILSACQTARGRVAAGEGVIGMSWALFVAGSPAVVVSEWKVDSARSADLMIEFHRNLRQSKRDGSLLYTRSESLRQAALKLLRGPYNHPAYWAGFILVGDDR